MATPEEQQPAALDTDDIPRIPRKRPAGRGRAFYPRKRAITACQVCRARKTKCDNLKPSCSYCLKAGVTCVQSPVDLSSFDPASLKILERLDELENTIQEGFQNISFQPLPNREKHDVEDVSSSPRDQWPESSDSDDVSLRSILPEKIESLLQWSIFQDQPVSNPPTHGPSDLAPTPPSSLGDVLDIQPSGINAILDSFFLYVHCKNPIFVEKRTRKLVLNKLSEGIDWSPESCLALLVCALGRIATPFRPNPETGPNTVPFTESYVFFQAGQKRLGSLLCQPSLIGPQCLLLSGIYMMHVHQPIYAWRLFSQALGACQHLPILARAAHSACTTGTPGTPVGSTDVAGLETQQQALYWSAWKSERELRSELLLPDFNPSASTLNLYPSFFPTPPVSAEVIGDTSDDHERASWLFYLSEISLRRLFSRVSHEIMDLHRTSGSNAKFLEELQYLVPEYEAQAQQWVESLPPELSLDLPHERDGVCVFVLRGHLVNFYEALYWPFLMARLTASVSSPDLARAVDELGKKGIEAHIRRIYVNLPGFMHRHHGTWFMIRTCMRSAVILLGAAKLKYPLPQCWGDAVWQVWRLVSEWEGEISDLREWNRFLKQSLEMHGISVA
ncbi:hypothetical protein V2G26_004351 [Clonostachys chloroleuca]